MNNLMKQAQKMQEKMARLQEELAERTIEATAGGGAVHVTANGRQEILAIKIDPEVVKADEVELLEDLILAAVNEARKKSEELAQAEMKKITGGMGLPPGLF
jgi:DNA-binding YbaB/EbfC family protein